MAISKEKLIDVSSGTIVRAILIGLFFAALYFLRDIMLVVLLSIVVASAIEPSTRFLHRRGVPRLLSVILMYSLLALGLILVLYFLFIPILVDTATFLSSLPSYLGDLKVWNPLDLGGISPQGTLGGISQNFSLVDIVDQLDNTIQKISQGVLFTASSIFGGMFSFIMVIVLSFYLSVESDGVTNFLKTVIPAKNESYVISLWQRSQHKIALWMQGQIVLAVIVAILVFLGLTILKMDNALLLAVIAGIFEIIPLFGPILAAIPAVTIALLSGGLTSGLLVIGLYIIIQQFENQLIYPLVVKKVVGVPPIVSILALIIGAKLAGFIGLVISVPLASVIIEYFNDLEKEKSAARALAGQ